MSVALRVQCIDGTASGIVPRIINTSPTQLRRPVFLSKCDQSNRSLDTQTPAGVQSRYKVDVRVDPEVLAIDRSQHKIEDNSWIGALYICLDYDKLILSQGADPFLPPVKGIDGPNVFTLYASQI